MASSKNNYSDADDFDFGGDSRSLTEQLDLQFYLRILRKNKWPITLFTALVTALAIYYVSTATPIYRATSTLLIESQKTNIVSVEELVGVDSENADYYQTQYEMLKSRGLAKKVVEVMNLYNHPELRPNVTADSENSGEVVSDSVNVEAAEAPSGVIGKLKALVPTSDTAEGNSENTGFMSEAELASADFGPLDELQQQAVVGRFMSRLSINPVRKTKLVKISFESADPEFAARVANTVAEQYILSYLDAKMEMTSKASTWLSDRLGTLKQTLDQSEDRLLTYKQENGLIDVGGSVARLNEQEMLIATTELSEARRQLSDVNDVYRQIRTLNGNPQLLESVPAIQADPLVRQVKIEQGQRQRELDELLNRYGSKHPKIVDAQSRLRSLNETMNGHISRAASVIEKDYQLARQRVSSLEATLIQGKQEIQNLGTKTFELESLEREVATNRDLYNTFFARMSEAKSADGLETANARLSDPAVAPLNPVKPKKQLIVALAALASLVLSMLMAFLYEQMDDTIKSTNDIEDKLGVKLLGILPLIKGGLFNKKQPLPLNPLEIKDKKGTFVEAVNTARTTICMDDTDDSVRKVILVTSSIPGEGKSTTAINLAYSLSQMERVLLVDCDMRRPTVAKAIGLEKNATGLSSLITKEATARDCIKRASLGELDVLPCGPMPDRPLELLASNRFRKIIDQLSEHYDRIVIDCAPTQAVSDALVLSKLSDAVVYCVKSHDTSIELVKRGLQRLSQAGAKIAGVLITQVDIDKLQSYGGDYYYQGYYDYYGYSDKEAKAAGAGKLRLSKEDLAQIESDDDDFDLGLGPNTRANGSNGSGSAAAAVASNGYVDSVYVDEGYDMPRRDGTQNGRVPTQRRVDRDVTTESTRLRPSRTADELDFSSEFDMTTQIDEGDRRPVRPTNGQDRGNPRSDRFIDDLDII